jgi:hypothetical protein
MFRWCLDLGASGAAGFFSRTQTNKTTNNTHTMPLTYRSKPPVPGGAYTVPSGDYRLIVLDAREDTSRSGNDMVKLTLRIIHPDGTEGPKMYDYLVPSETCLWKIDQFLKSCGHHPGGEEEISISAESMTGWECRARLRQERSKDCDGVSMKVDSYLWDE